MKITKKTIKDIPFRKSNESEYNRIYIVPSGLKHDSGYMTIHIIGIKDDESLERCACPDDINWDMTELNQKYDCTGMRMDCLYPQGIIQCHGRHVKYIVGYSLSSTTIKVVNRQ
jgi:hypothetical protein